MEWPSLCVAIFTYEPDDGNEPRGTAEPTLRAFLDNALYPIPINVHIADDGSPESHREMLREVAGGYPNVGTVGVTNSGQHGYGASYNRASQSIHSGSEIVLPLEDDWTLTRVLDLCPLVETLLTVDEIDCIRLGYIGWTQELRGRLIETPAGQMLLFDPESPEPHVFAGHARIETRDFERSVGEWPVDTQAGATEMLVAKRPEARRGVAWPLELIPPSGGLFVHTGAKEFGEHRPENAQ